jgi:hypothetical protein
MQVSGNLPMGEAQKACKLLMRRVFGWKRYFAAIYFCALSILMFGGASVFYSPKSEINFGWIWFFACLVVGLIAYQVIWKKIAFSTFQDRGAPAVSAITYSVTDRGLVLNSEESEQLFYWSAVSELTMNRTYCVFIVRGMGYVIPRRFFSDRTVEQDFLVEAWTHMTPEARARGANLPAYLTA